MRFSFDARSHSTEVLAAVKAELLRRAQEIGLRRGVEFKFGRFSQGEPAAMTDNLRRRLAEGAAELGIPFVEMASGAGHDAAVVGQWISFGLSPYAYSRTVAAFTV